MKVIFANDTLAKLKFLALSEEAGSGFLRTERIGKYLLITDLISGNICRDSVKEDIMNIYDLWGFDFGGIFMKKEIDLIPECLMEKIVLKVRNGQYRIFYFNSETDEHDLIQEGSLH